MFINRSRAIIIFILTIIFTMGIVFRLTSLSFIGIFNKKHSFPINNTVLRGMIFDRNGIIMAGSRQVYSIAADPQELNNINRMELRERLNELSRILGIKTNKIINILLRGASKKFVWLKRKVQNKAYLAIKSLNIKGIYFKEEYKRVYPHSSTASHLLGFAGIDDVGLEGLELAYDDILKPDSDNKEIAYGDHLYLTIDYYIQRIAERVLEGGVKKYNAEGGTILVMDSSNGEILSLANYPNYDNNRFQLYSKVSYKNVAITNHYEPGSTFKMFVAAMLLEEKKVNLKELFYCSGSITIGGRLIKCPHKHGYIDIRGILKKSCNVGIITASMRLQRKVFYNYLKRFGFGEETKLGLLGESAGVIKNYNKINALSQAMISFGYEVAVTPLQLAMASSVIANGGILYKPILIKKLVDKDNRVFSRASSVVRRRVISKRTSSQLMFMLESVLEPGGTGERGNIKGISIAGKTGTVNIYNPERGKYDSDNVNTIFIGFLPSYDRVLTVLVMFRKPGTNKSSSFVSVPIFKKLASEILSKGLY